MAKRRGKDQLIAVCIPTRGIVFTEVVQAVFDNLAGRPAVLLTTTDEGLPDCMNALADRALAAGASHLWVVEEDTVPPAGVLDAMLEADVDYIACDYPVGGAHTCFGFDEDGILWTGFGCTLIRSGVFDQVARPFFECDMRTAVVRRDGLDYFTAEKGTADHRGGHDLSFGAKLKRAGVRRHGLRDWECRHLRLAELNAGAGDKACHTIVAQPPILAPWPEYLEPPTCTIVIPCFNHGEYLAEAIESALAQTLPCEVIVVDDGSTDDTAAVARRYPVKLIRQKNRGLPAARNAAVEIATTTHIMPLDADDLLEPACVETLLGKSRHAIVRATTQLFGDVNMPWLLEGPTTLAAQIEMNRAPACSLYPRAAWERVGGYDEAMVDGYEDWDFWTRVMHAGFPIETVDTVQWRYRKHGPSLVRHAASMRPQIKAYLREKWARLGILSVTAARDSRGKPTQGVPMFTVKHRVYGKDANGRNVLLYAQGDEITDDQARSAGLLDGEAPAAPSTRGVTIVDNKPVDDTPPKVEPLERLKLAELKKIAGEWHLDTDGLNTRADYIAAIEDARERLASATGAEVTR